MRVLDLFSGIGGFSLGLERAKLEGAEINGFETVAFCEIEEFPRKILAKHWPNVPCYDDVRTLTAERLAADGIAVDAICGGFPCQDISFAGLGAGLAGERSGLFYEIARLVGELEPRYIILENVAALLSRGLGDVLGTLASLGYDAEWHCIPASAVGAHHRRDRVWIIAYANGALAAGLSSGAPAEVARIGDSSQVLANSQSDGQPISGSGYEVGNDHSSGAIKFRVEPCGSSASRHAEAVANTDSERGCCGQADWQDASDAWEPSRHQGDDRSRVGAWLPEPNVGRVANGVPDRAHRLKALGNAVVPQIPELIGNAILRSINLQHAETSAL